MRFRRAGKAVAGLKGALRALVAPFFGVVVMLAGLGFMLVPTGPAAAAPPAPGWTTTKAPLPNDAGSTGSLPETYLASSACPAANGCLTAGWYYDSADHAWGVIEQQNGKPGSLDRVPELRLRRAVSRPVVPDDDLLRRGRQLQGHGELQPTSSRDDVQWDMVGQQGPAARGRRR
jgi:hypothetical protein